MSKIMPLSQQSLAALSVAPSAASDKAKTIEARGIEAEAIEAEAIEAKSNRPASDSDRVCWAELKRYPYHPDHQVELLHLQAEADALIIKLQAANREVFQHES